MQAKGNAAFASGQFEDAIKHFTEAIEIDPGNHVLYSNRSAANASLFNYENALADATKVTELKPDWPKGWSRVGAAYYGLRKWDEAIEAYEKGVKLDPSNEQLLQGLENSKKSKSAQAQPESGLFSQPEVLSRLATDPRTKSLLTQPDFMSMLSKINEDPGSMQQYMADERLLLALEVGLGLKLSSKPPTDDQPSSEAAKNVKKQEQTKEKEEKVAEVEMTEEEKEEKESKAAANKEKEAGNAAYRNREFEKAIEHYNKAIEKYDKDISFITNRAAVKFEQEDYNGCIADCDAAIEKGREIRADYKLIARAMTRKGNAQARLGDLEAAISTYNSSLTEHRNADTLKRLQEAEKALKEQKEAEYIDLEKCAEEKEAGNTAFKEARYPDAVQHYTEALKRGPPSVNSEAYKLFSNRAACYTKLGALPEGLKDADECIKLAPDFAKGYSRKGHIQYFMKEYNKAMETYRAGLEHDPNNEELKEGLMRCIDSINRTARGEVSEAELKQRQERAMADPEIQGILTDPVMRQVLQDMQEDPASAQRHLAHPEVAAKLDKLVQSGIVQIR